MKHNFNALKPTEKSTEQRVAHWRVKPVIQVAAAEAEAKAVPWPERPYCDQWSWRFHDALLQRSVFASIFGAEGYWHLTLLAHEPVSCIWECILERFPGCMLTIKCWVMQLYLQQNDMSAWLHCWPLLYCWPFVALKRMSAIKQEIVNIFRYFVHYANVYLMPAGRRSMWFYWQPESWRLSSARKLVETIDIDSYIYCIWLTPAEFMKCYELEPRCSAVYQSAKQNETHWGRLCVTRPFEWWRHIDG